MIKIVAEKVIVRGIKCVMVTSIDMLTVNELPEEYTQKEPSCWKLSGSVIHRRGWGQFMFVGELCNREDFDKKIEFIHECGDRLKTINDRLKIENAGWEGTLEVRI